MSYRHKRLTHRAIGEILQGNKLLALLARIVILEDKRRLSSWLSDASLDPILC